jgi:hypothetical protein
MSGSGPNSSFLTGAGHFELVLRELPKAGPRRLPEKHREGVRFPVVDSQARNLPARILLLLSYLCWRVAG